MASLSKLLKAKKKMFRVEKRASTSQGEPKCNYLLHDNAKHKNIFLPFTNIHKFTTINVLVSSELS